MSPTLNFPTAVRDLFAESLHLRELTEADIPAWFARATDVESADLAGDPIPESIEMGAAWLQRHRDRFQQQTAIRWSIMPKGATESAGTVGLVITSKEHRTAEFGIVVGRAYWGKGFGTAAAQLVTRYGFDTLGLAEIQAEVLQRNVASLRLLEKTGFQRLREIPGDPQSGGESDDCFEYVLRSSRRSDA
jgi:[ribosomal protein S5]-alanine N-acetyltransferase